MAEVSPHRRADIDVAHAGDAVTLKVPSSPVTLTTGEAQELAGRLYEASARACGEDPEENDLVRLPMQYIRAATERIEGVEPDAEPGTPLYEELQGAKSAEVHCWIANQTRQNAMYIATGWVAEHGWIITDVIEHEAVTRDDFEGTEYLPYYEQALTDSEVFLYEIDEAETEEAGGSTDAP